VSWKPELDEIARREALARRMGGEERVARHRAAGRLPVRERIERLLDAGSFHESGALAGRAEYGPDGALEGFTPSNFVCGRGRIDGRPVVVGGDDFTVRGGAADGAVGNKMGWAEKAARDLRLPLVRLVDGTGGGGSVKTHASLRRSYVPYNPDWDVSVELLSRVPVVAAALGPVAGLGAARVAASTSR
jgi:acetyl-CoA carboxylase carboxyltransferase component